MFKYWSWLVSLGKHFLTYLVWKERKIRSYDGARFPCLTHLCKISDMRIFKPSSTLINMPSAENKLADIINILTSNVVKTLQRFPRFCMVFSYSRFILDGKGKKKGFNMDRDGRMVCPTLAPAGELEPSLHWVSSYPLLALRLDKPFFHPHPCKILIILTSTQLDNQDKTNISH